MQYSFIEVLIAVHPARIQTGIKKVVNTMKNKEMPSKPITKLRVVYSPPLEAC
jgi:hypothetical protein